MNAPEEGSSSRPHAASGARASVDLAQARWGLALVLAVGVVLRFVALSHQSIWYDEAVSIRLAGAPLGDLFAGRIRDLGNPPFHAILLHLWETVFGASDASARALSATVSLASVPFVYAVARRLAGEPVALLAAGIDGVSPVQIYFAQEARTYALVGLLCLASVFFLLRAVESPRRLGSWIGYAAAVFLALYSHYFAAFVVIAEVVWIALCQRRRPVLLGTLGALLGAGVVYAGVWLPSLIAQATTKGNLGRAGDTWYLQIASTPLVFGVGTTLLWKGATAPLRVVGGALALMTFAGLALLGGWSIRRQRAPLTLLLAWLGAPIVLPLLISLTLFPFFYVRYALVAAPAYYILVALGLRHLTGVRRATAGALLVATCALSLGFYFTTLVKHDWRGAAAWIKGKAGPGDVLAFDADIGETAFAHYAGDDDKRIRLLDPPASAGGYWGTSSHKEPAHAVGQQLNAARRVWFVFSDPQSGAGDYYRELFAHDWLEVDEREFRGIAVHVVEHKP